MANDKIQMTNEERIEELFIELPDVPKLPDGVLPAVLVDKLLYIGGQLPFQAGKVSFKGRLGVEIALDQGRLAARYALLVCLSAVHQTLGSLNKVKNFVQMTGFVASGADFKEHDRVLDDASKLLVDIFGSSGKHSRIAVGVNQLPQNACVEISLILAVK